MDFLKPAVAIGSISLLRYVDLTDPDNITYARIAFAIGTGLAWFTLLIIYMLIKSRSDTTPLTVQQSDIDPKSAAAANPLAALTGGSAEPSGPSVETTVLAYDLIKYKALVNSALFAPIITAVLHYQFQFVQPLILQSVLNIMTVLTSELARIYLFQSKLKRPFRNTGGGPFAAFKQLKKEMQNVQENGVSAAMNGTGSTANNSRRNKKLENKMKINKTS